MAVATVCISDTCRESHCATCDAHPGECDHQGARYLHPIVYELVQLEGDAPSWKVPEHERVRWDAAPLRPEAKPVLEEARDVEEVLLELAGGFYVDARLEAKLRVVHDLQPLRVSRLSRATLEGAATGKLTNPVGFLWSRLAEIERSKTNPQ